MAARRTKSRQPHGQVLLMVVLILVGLGIAGATVVYLTQIASLHGMGGAQRMKARMTSLDGINYAVQTLGADLPTWQNALQATFAPTTGCNTGAMLTGPSGNQFMLSCSTGTTGNPNLQPYQVAVTAVAFAPSANGPAKPMRAVKAYVSQRTLGVDTANGVHAAAAVQLVMQPSIASRGSFNIHWGPLLLLDPNPVPWNLPSPMDGQQYPRKFALRGVTGTAFTRFGAADGSGSTTDQKEYWSNLPVISPPFIDEPSYMTLAQQESNIPASGTSSLGPSSCQTSACGYYNPGNGTVVFDNGYSVPPGSVIFVNGNAEFDSIAIDSATFIVTGTLTVKNSTTIHHPAVHVPISAPAEYPYYPANPAAWPCSNLWPDQNADGTPNFDCTTDQVFGNTGDYSFHGFLYVKGNMIVTSNVTWNMVGALLVGDRQAQPTQIQVQGRAALNVAYDDVINHSILVFPTSTPGIRLVPDQIQDVPTP